MARKKTSASSPGELPQLPASVAGLAAAEPEIVRWVARQIDNPNPSPTECPDPFAWTLLRLCRADPEFVVWFVDKLWSKLIPSRSQLEQGGPASFDGKPTRELIAKIQAMKEKAESE